PLFLAGLLRFAFFLFSARLFRFCLQIVFFYTIDFLPIVSYFIHYTTTVAAKIEIEDKFNLGKAAKKYVNI
ncbi:MAG: hypothetical protein LBL98_01750, partial [Ruminococcus sp.]|nr:hypothetical protein [Ruminococcus sp.]